MSTEFGKDDHGNIIRLYTITNGKLSAKIMDYGATIVQLLFPNNQNMLCDLVLGFDNFNDYQSSRLNPYFGSTIGRFANRIAQGKFELNGRSYQLYQNNGRNSLHGGRFGFNCKKWNLVDRTDDSLEFQYQSMDGEENFPGTVIVTVRFTITEMNELQIEYTGRLADSTADNLETIISLTNHSYFNLNGCSDRSSLDILNHRIFIHANSYLELNDEQIPTGQILPVKGTVMDFSNQSTNHTIGDRNFQYDHCYVLENDPSKWWLQYRRPLKVAAEVFSDKSGIKMSFMTDEPGFQFYIGEYIPKFHTKQSQSSIPFELGPNSGLCLEAQRFPDAINHPKWSNQVILKSNDVYIQKTIFKFENF